MFTDIEGSTRLHQALGERYVPLISEHDSLVSQVIDAYRGVVVASMGDGLFAAFESAVDGVDAAAQIQRVVAKHPWPDAVDVKVRIGLHSGMAQPHGPSYIALAVHQAARVSAIAHGGQVVATDAVVAAAQGSSEVFESLGEHRLKDFDVPVPLFQVGSDRFPPLPTIANTNLPKPVDKFFGRAREMEELAGLLKAGTRFVTLIGPGGVGKTRLAVETAADLVSSYRAGVFWVDLSQLRDQQQVLTAIASTIGARTPLVDHIGDRAMLLLLDNLEHVIDAAPDLATLVEACPGLRLVVTSRERLRVRGEVVIAVEPLPASDAALLFAERAGLEPDAGVSTLCAELDNLPLALELASARARVISVDQISKRLGRRLDSLTGRRDAGPRHSTLRSTIAWSFDLLDPVEQRSFVRLAVFKGGFTLDAAELVTGVGVGVLQSLVDKSLIRLWGGRFSFLESIREFADERLRHSPEAHDMRQRHAAWFVDLATGGRDPRWQSVSSDWVGQVHAENDNLRAALAWALEQPVPTGFALGEALLQPWKMRGQLSELVTWYRQALETWPGLDAVTRATALTSYGSALNFLEEYAQAEGALAEAVELCRQLRDTTGEAQALRRLSNAVAGNGDLPRATALARRGLDLAQKAGDAVGMSRSLHQIGDTLRDMGEFAGAVTALEEAARCALQSGHRHAASASLHSLGDVALASSDAANARTSYLASLDIAREHADERTALYCLAGLACVAVLQHDLATAGVLWAVTEEAETRIGQMLSKERVRYERRLHSVAGHEHFVAGRLAAEGLAFNDVVADLLTTGERRLQSEPRT
jgi:predicted ATPase